VLGEVAAGGRKDRLTCPARAWSATATSHGLALVRFDIGGDCCNILCMMNSSNDEFARSPSDPAIEIRDLHVRRGGKVILPGIWLRVPPGRVTGLLGPSGSGKTTLMRAIVGVQIVERGQVTVLGQPAGTPALRRRVAYVTQAPSVYADLTVEENLHYFARILRAPRQRIEEVIRLVGLTGQTRQVAHTLSGGEISRASLAVALLGKPELLVLDEPTVDVDPILRRELWQTFYGLAEDGASLLVSSHVMDEAARCHELVLMRSGQIIAAGSPDELLERSHSDQLEDAFVALAEAA
jgi:ABC-2 type transport system ATP-binding protein